MGTGTKKIQKYQQSNEQLTERHRHTAEHRRELDDQTR